MAKIILTIGIDEGLSLRDIPDTARSFLQATPARLLAGELLESPKSLVTVLKALQPEARFGPAVLESMDDTAALLRDDLWLSEDAEQGPLSMDDVEKFFIRGLQFIKGKAFTKTGTLLKAFSERKLVLFISSATVAAIIEGPQRLSDVSEIHRLQSELNAEILVVVPNDEEKQLMDVELAATHVGVASLLELYVCARDSPPRTSFKDTWAPKARWQLRFGETAFDVLAFSTAMPWSLPLATLFANGEQVTTDKTFRAKETLEAVGPENLKKAWRYGSVLIPVGEAEEAHARLNTIKGITVRGIFPLSKLDHLVRCGVSDVILPADNDRRPLEALGEALRRRSSVLLVNVTWADGRGAKNAMMQPTVLGERTEAFDLVYLPYTEECRMKSPVKFPMAVTPDTRPPWQKPSDEQRLALRGLLDDLSNESIDELVDPVWCRYRAEMTLCLTGEERVSPPEEKKVKEEVKIESIFELVTVKREPPAPVAEAEHGASTEVDRLLAAMSRPNTAVVESGPSQLDIDFADMF